MSTDQSRVARLPRVEAVETGGANCVWCGAALVDGTPLRGRIRCRECGAATTAPWPSEADLEAAYGTWYRPSTGRRFSFIGDSILSRTRAQLASRLDRLAPAGPVLDVGAGDGTLLDALRAEGREATGLERGSARPDFRDEPLDQIDGEWAAVVFWHSLEHLPGPSDAIRQSARLLTENGLIAIAVPNSDSLQAKAFGDHWLHLDLPRHLVHLSKRSLIGGLEASGFRVEHASGWRAGQIVIGWLDGLVGSLPGDLNFYQSLRRREARSVAVTLGQRIAAIAAGIVLLPVAMICSAVEVALGRSGTIYVEARLV